MIEEITASQVIRLFGETWSQGRLFFSSAPHDRCTFAVAEIAWIGATKQGNDFDRISGGKAYIVSLPQLLMRYG